MEKQSADPPLLLSRLKRSANLFKPFLISSCVLLSLLGSAKKLWFILASRTWSQPSESRFNLISSFRTAVGTNLSQPQPPVCVHARACVCLCVCVYYLCVYSACVWRPEVNLECSSGVVYVGFLKQGPLLAWNSPSRPGYFTFKS